MSLDKASWLGCLLWHGWLPMLSGVNGASPWAIDASESAAYLLEVALGRYSSGLVSEWVPSGDFDREMAASSLPDHPDVWTDGSLVLDHLTNVSSSGSGFFAYQEEHFWRHRRWGHVDGVRLDPDLACCRGFCSVPGPLQSVQRAEMWESFWPCRPLVLFTLVLIILVWFGMLVVCWMVVLVLMQSPQRIPSGP